MIKIKKNDYVQPTEIRENLVKMMCDYIIKEAERCHGYGWRIYLSEPRQVWVTTDEQVTEIHGFDNSQNKTCRYPQIRVNGVELRKVFELLQVNGWHLHNFSGGVSVLREPIYKDTHFNEIKFFID